MCGCEKHWNESAECTCYCGGSAHRSFDDDATFLVRQAALPWPDVMECHWPARTLVEQGHTCPQCDGSHDHEWVAGPPVPSGTPVRCKHCGGRKCDLSSCLLRRHHRGDHEYF